ncbi:MAG: hypothetical protein WA364_03540 [Candidatus Nitrosopolaris sp.]
MNHISLINYYLRFDSFVYDNDISGFIKYRNKIDVIALISQRAKDNSITGITKPAMHAKSYMPYSTYTAGIHEVIRKSINSTIRRSLLQNQSGVVAATTLQQYNVSNLL